MIKHKETGGYGDENNERNITSCTGLVRILVLYTPAAEQAANVHDIAFTAIGQTNVGLYNSNVAYRMFM